MSAARVGMSAAMQGRSSPALGALVAVLTACSGSTVASSSPPTTSPTPSSVTTNAPTPPIPPEPMVQQMIAQAVLDHPRVAGPT